MDQPQTFSPLSRRAMAFVLAGWRGDSLMELTDTRAKPAVYFGGKLRIIDFTLSNALNSGVRRIAVATQYKAHSLIRHLQKGWNFLRAERNESFDILPASQRVSESMWYRGTADAVHQNAEIILSYDPDYLIVIAGDRIYEMDYEAMLQQHVAQNADVTIACILLPNGSARRYGVMKCDEADRVLTFRESPEADDPIFDGQDEAHASIGVYVFRTEFLLEVLRRDAADAQSQHDFGHNIIPRLVREANAVAHPFERSCVRSKPNAPVYWRDVDSLDDYFAANIGLTDVVPDLDLYDRNWPLWSYSEMLPPSKFVHDAPERLGTAISSVVAGGAIISGAVVRHSLLFSHVRIHSYSALERAVIFPEVEIGRHVRLRNVIVNRDVKIPDGLVVGDDPDLDARRFRRTEGGVCLITQSMINLL